MHCEFGECRQGRIACNRTECANDERLFSPEQACRWPHVLIAIGIAAAVAVALLVLPRIFN